MKPSLETSLITQVQACFEISAAKLTLAKMQRHLVIAECFLDDFGGIFDDFGREEGPGGGK